MAILPGQVEEKKKYYCDKCQKTMGGENFYTSNNLEKYPNDGKLNLCKKCATMHVDNWDPNTFLWLLEELDVPWIPDEWNKLMLTWAKDPTKINGTSILGRYLAKMRLSQNNAYRWKDNELIQEKQKNKLRETMQAQGYSNDQIAEVLKSQSYIIPDSMRPADDALPVVDQFGIVQITPEKSSTNTMKSTLPVAAGPDELGLTDDDVVYLRMKWGNGYKPEDWVWLERLYNDMCDSYDVQTAGHKDTLILVCKTSLKCNQLVDLGDIEGYQKMSRVYNDLMKSGKFTAAQNKEEQGEFVDSISEIVALCEKDGFIPRFYQDSPNDKVDRTIQDMQIYTRNLVETEHDLGELLETAAKQVAKDRENEANVSAEAAGEEDRLEKELFDTSSDEKGYTASDEADFQDFEEDLEEQDNLIMRRLLQEEEE